MARRTWTDEKIARLVAMRDTLNMKWDAIGAAFGVTAPKVCTKYHSHKSQLRVDAKRRELGLAVRPPPPAPAIEELPDTLHGSARRCKGWTEHEVQQLIDMRENRRMKWREIARALGRSGERGGMSVCSGAYAYWTAKFKREAAMRAKGIEPPKQMRHSAASHDTPIAAPPVVAKGLAEPVKRPRYFHQVDMDLIARIERQGLTAGFLGDPPKGRSALDRKEGRA
jgi:hypothetical protein